MHTIEFAQIEQLLILLVVGAPGLAFLALSLAWLAGWDPRERLVARLTGVAFTASGMAVLALLWEMASHHQWSAAIELGSWFRVGNYAFPITLLADSLSLPLLALTTVLVGVVASFSRRYLHREHGYLRFFILLNLFGFAALLAFSAGSVDLLVCGWELVGLTSVLLIAFFQERREPVRNAVRVFVTYHVCDLGLVIGALFLHGAASTTLSSILFKGAWPMQSTELSAGAATVAGLLLLLAASGKSAQVPFSGWLPRAMEGPTPSSAIFYGAIAVHLGVYLLLRAQPIFQNSTIASSAVVGIGLVTAVHATLSGRVASDAKTSLAYASLAQIGLIFVETGFGFSRLALVHMIGHAAVRTLQFLRAPSMLHDYHRVHAAAGGQLAPTGTHYEALLSPVWQIWLYRLGLERGYLDSFLDRFVAHPFLRMAQLLSGFKSERRIHPGLLAGPEPEGKRLTGKLAEGFDA